MVKFNLSQQWFNNTLLSQKLVHASSYNTICIQSTIVCVDKRMHFPPFFSFHIALFIDNISNRAFLIRLFDFFRTAIILFSSAVLMFPIHTYLWQ